MNYFRAVTLLLVGLCLSIQAAPTVKKQPSQTFSSKVANITFYEHAEFRGYQKKHNFPAASTACQNVAPGLSSVRVNMPIEDPTCIVLFSKTECRGTKDGFVFRANSTLRKLNDKLSSFRLCNDEESEHSP